MILVTGATGHVGSEVVSQLLDRGLHVRALVRDRSAAELPAGAEAVAGDLADPRTLKAGLAGVDSVFLLPGYPDAVPAIAAAGVGRIVLLSGSSAASGDLTNAITRYMSESESAVRAAGDRWTIVRPVAFMANALRWIPQLEQGDVVRVQFPNVRAACIDPVDIAGVAVAALTESEHAGAVYDATGPESLLPEDQIAVLADVLKRDLRVEPLSDEQTRREIAEANPPEYVDAFLDFYANGSLDESSVSDTVETITGRAPRTFREWATRHANEFR